MNTGWSDAAREPERALRAVKAISRSQLNDGYGPDSDPSRGDQCRRALRPIEASKAAIRDGCFTSTPAVCGATMRRCRRAAGCRPRLLAIAPFKSERARAIGARMSAFSGCSTTSVEGAQGDASLTPVQAPKTASLLVSRQWPWTCASQQAARHGNDGWEDPRAKSA